MDFDREKIVASFLAESEEGLDRTEQYLIAAETDPENSELLEEMFRVAHTIKGNAAALDFPELAGFAHVMEDLLESVRAQTVPLSHDVVALLLHAVDALRALVPAAGEGNDRLSPSHQEVKRLMTAHASGLAVATQPFPDSTFAEVPSPAPVPGAAVLGSRSRTLRVDVQKLDEMLNLTGEIAVVCGRVRSMIADLPGEQGRRLLDIHREVEDLAGEPEPRAQHGAAEEHDHRLQRERHGRERQRDAHLRRRRRQHRHEQHRKGALERRKVRGKRVQQGGVIGSPHSHLAGNFTVCVQH